ncbi:MAG TPA: hypothetical protein VMH87_19520 [Pseudomonadales bacterium]|nr:hypothetical protein [Pseudomonadales bacterium]
MKLWIKIGAAGLAFVPLALYFLSGFLVANGLLPENIGRVIAIGCAIFNFPAFMLVYLVESFQANRTIEFLVLLGSTFLWSSFLAWFFWQMAKEFLGENEPEFETNPERAKYDWSGFWVRFVIGFVLGFLVGWRFVRYSTSITTCLIAMTVTGLFCGLAYGLYRPNFWAR